MSVLREKAKQILNTKSGDITVLDVACGDAIATRQVFKNTNHSEHRTIRYVGLDHDANLLAEARRRWPPLEIHRADMVRATIEEKHDLILCSFAYHHVPDSEKVTLCKNLLKWCRPTGDLLVLDICLSASQVHEYYTAVKSKLKAGLNRQSCIKFLDWTMSADYLSNGEWKVPMARLEKDFKQAGWALCESEAIWTAQSLPPQTGCYYFHFQPKP